MDKYKIKRQLINKLPYEFTELLLCFPGDVYHKYLTNTIACIDNENHTIHRDKYITNRINSLINNKYSIIGNSFWWERTPEGSSYWDKIDTLWKAHCKINKSYNNSIMKQNQFEFKPFDKVLVRDANEAIWKVNFFSHINKNKYNDNQYCCVTGNWPQCIPYNEETAHLLGTNKPYEKPKPKVWTVKTEEDQIQSFTHDEFLKFIENIKKDKSECAFIFGYTGIENSN